MSYFLLNRIYPYTETQIAKRDRFTFSTELFDWFEQAVKKSRVLEIPRNQLEKLDKEDRIKGGMGELDIATWKKTQKRVVIKKVTTQTLDMELHFIYEVGDSVDI